MVIENRRTWLSGLRWFRTGLCFHYAGLRHDVTMAHVGRFWWPDYSWVARDY